MHIQFNYNGVGSEIQLHTAQNWEIKKQLDEIYHVLREQEINPTLTQAEWERLNRESKRLAQDFDVDINLFTSFEVISTESKSAASLNSRNATNEENLTHILRLKSYSKTPPSSDASAYNRPDSVLNQKEEILTGGKGTDSDIQAPLKEDSTPPLKKPSIREQALAFRQEQKRKEQEALEAKEAKYKAERQEQEQAYQASLAQKESQAGTKENQKDLKLGTPIAMQRLQGRSSSVSLDDDHIYPLDFVVVKAKDIKPSFNTGVGTQTRTQTNSKMVEQIAQNFKPEMVLNRGGFDDLPLILSDGQVIAGNHRAKGMQNFTPQSRHTYEQAILEHYGLELKGDELLMRTPKNELDTQEIINLASASNKERAHTYGDKLIAALGKYDSKITPDNLENYLKQSHDVQELAQNVGRALDTQAKEPDIEGANLALLAQSARNTQDYTLSKALNDAQKTLDIEDFSKLKEMLVKNAGSFYTLLRDSRLPNLHLAPYLTQSIPSMAHALKTTRQENFTKLYETLSDLLKTTDEHGINALVKMNPGVYDAMASELLGASLARFVRLENPAQSFYEFLKNAPEGLNALVADTLLKRIEGIPSKPLNEANVYDFISLAINSGEKSPISSKLNDLLPEFEKKAREAKKILKGEDKIVEPNPAFGENFSEFEGKGAQVLLDGRGRADLLDPKKLSKVEQESGEIKPIAVIEKAEDKEAFIKSLDLSAHATPIPESLDVEGFLKTLEGVKNHKNFIEHLASRTDGQRRLEYLHLVEPTLKNPDIELIFKAPAKKEYVKTFRQEGKKDLVYLLVTKDDDALLITGIVDAKKGYVRGRI
ncbi:unnamed protein product, partial [Helicobacter felis ATCC 49179]